MLCICAEFYSVLFFYTNPCLKWGFPGGALVAKDPPANAGDEGLIPGSGRSLEKEMATHSSILAWEIPWTEEPGGLVHRVAKSQT